MHVFCWADLIWVTPSLPGKVVLATTLACGDKKGKLFETRVQLNCTEQYN